MKYKITYSKAYKKHLKSLAKADIAAVENVIDKLANDKKLESKHKDHALSGNLKGFRECHIKLDLLLIYEKDSKRLILAALSLGSHSKLFKK